MPRVEAMVRRSRGGLQATLLQNTLLKLRLGLSRRLTGSVTAVRRAPPVERGSASLAPAVQSTNDAGSGENRARRGRTSSGLASCCSGVYPTFACRGVAPPRVRRSRCRRPGQGDRFPRLNRGGAALSGPGAPFILGYAFASEKGRTDSRYRCGRRAQLARARGGAFARFRPPTCREPGAAFP